MTLEKCIEQLKDLRIDRESFLDGKYNPELDKGRPEFEDNPFVEDIEAIDTALAAIEKLKKAKELLNAALCELNNGTCVKFCSTCTKVNTEKCKDYKHKCYHCVRTEEVLKLIEKE